MWAPTTWQCPDTTAHLSWPWRLWSFKKTNVSQDGKEYKDHTSSTKPGVVMDESVEENVGVNGGCLYADLTTEKKCE